VSFSALAGPSSAGATLTTKVSCAVADGTVIRNQATSAFALSDPTPADNAAWAADVIAVNPAPAVSAVSVDTPIVWPPNKKMKTVKVGYEVADNCPGTTCSLAVTCDEGSEGSDWHVVDAHTVMVRADRDGNGSGRTYSIAVTCKDSGG